MILLFSGQESNSDNLSMKTMFIDRKKIFSDILKWDVSIYQEKYEIDQFDSDCATYIIVANDEGKHLASARLLPTSRDHILGAIFPNLCDGPVPIGEHIFEITRFCLSPSQSARDRLVSRKRLVTALAEYGLSTGVQTYTGVAERFWYDQIASFGWQCSALGSLSRDSRKGLVALRIDLDEQTIAGLRTGGMYADISWNVPAERIAA